MAGTVTDAQHALSDILRRMRFMAQFNGDTEERLVSEFWCMPLAV